MTSSPTWSIVLPTFNRDRLLRVAIRSVLEQTEVDWELIVVDDGSEDGTQALGPVYRSDARIHYVRQDHAGRSAARNHGFSLARGEFICFLDSDDRYLSTALATHAKAFAGGRIGLTIGGYQYIDEAGAVIGERRPWTECDTLTPEAWLFNCFAMPGSVVVRREWFEGVGGFDFGLETGEDWDLFLRLAFAGCPMAWAADLVCQRRLHPTNSTNDVSRHRDGSLRALDKLFRSAGLPAAVVALEDRAKAWAYAASARNAASLGLDELVRENLRAAADLNALPHWERRGLSLSPQGFPSFVEGLLADVIARDGATETDVSDLLAKFPSRWNIAGVDVRRGLARVEMSRFFDALARGARGEAARHLRRGLKHDRRWLVNRAVIAFLVRRPLEG
jgi:glycosyltransferase involved in cell wall biosynthesis